MLQVHAAYRQHKPAWKTENEALEEEIPIKRIVNFGQSIKKIEQSFKTLQKDGKKTVSFQHWTKQKDSKKKRVAVTTPHLNMAAMNPGTPAKLSRTIKRHSTARTSGVLQKKNT